MILKHTYLHKNITGLWKGVLKLGHKSLFCNYLYFNHIFWNNRIIRGCQGFQYFSRLPVLHYLQAVLFLKNWTFFMPYCKKKSLYNQAKPYFFKTLLWSHFWIDFSKFYTKTFRIIYILTVYLLIMFKWVVFICT